MPSHRQACADGQQRLPREQQDPPSFPPNLHERRLGGQRNRWVKLKVSNHALRTIDKNGIDAVLADLRARGEKV
jgi:hypothetical protein